MYNDDGYLEMTGDDYIEEADAFSHWLRDSKYPCKVCGMSFDMNVEHYGKDVHLSQGPVEKHHYETTAPSPPPELREIPKQIERE